MSDRPTGTPTAWVIPGLIFVIAAALYVVLASLQKVPLVTPDEIVYGHLARSVGSGQGLTWFGLDQQLPARLTVYLLAPSWLVASGESAYVLAKATGAVVACTVVFPVWFLARRTLSNDRIAAAPAALAVAGTWMLSTGGLLSENLAFPLTTSALVCAVLALRETERRWIWIALGFSVLATLARPQTVVLFPIILTALLLDLLIAEHPRARLMRHRAPAAVCGLVVLAGAAAVLSGSSAVLGPYAAVSDFAPPLGRVLLAFGNQWLALAIASAVAPVSGLLALAVDRSAWRDRDLGPLLCVAVPGVVLLIVQTGYFIADAGANGLPWSIERYIEYVIPLLLVLLCVAVDHRRLGPRSLGVASLIVVLTLLATPQVGQSIEEPGRFATSKVLALDTWLAVTVVGILVSAAILVVMLKVDRRRQALGLAGLLLLVLGLQSQSSWRWHVDFSEQWRAQYPKQMTWVDDHAGGPVSRMYLFQNSPLFETAELFNSSIEQVLGPSIQVPGRTPIGPTCSWTASPRGLIQPSPACDPIRGRVWNDDPFISMSFHGGTFLARDPFLGQLIAVPRHPRLKSMIRRPCQRATLAGGTDGSPAGFPTGDCQPNMSINLWLDAPGDLELTFRGGSRPQHVKIGDQRWRLAANRPTTVRVPLNSAAPRLTVALDWTARIGTPALTAATLLTGDRREPLI